MNQPNWFRIVRIDAQEHKLAESLILRARYEWGSLELRFGRWGSLEKHEAYVAAVRPLLERAANIYHSEVADGNMDFLSGFYRCRMIEHCIESLDELMPDNTRLTTEFVNETA